MNDQKTDLKQALGGKDELEPLGDVGGLVFLNELLATADDREHSVSAHDLGVIICVLVFWKQLEL